MRSADCCDPPSAPRLRGPCPDCGRSPCQCEDIALTEFDEGGEG